MNRKPLIGATVGTAGVVYGAVHAGRAGYSLTATGFAIAAVALAALIAREWMRRA